MKKHYLPYLLIVLLTLFYGNVIVAQVNKKTNTKQGTKFNPRLVKTYLGEFTGKNITVSVEDGKHAITMPLRLLDDKNVAYEISSYQFAYTRWGAVEDEVTGKVTQQSTLSADRFTTTPLPALWQSNVTDFLHSGEELYFYDIIAFDKQGRRFFAPEIKLIIQ